MYTFLKAGLCVYCQHNMTFQESSNLYYDCFDSKTETWSVTRSVFTLKYRYLSFNDLMKEKEQTNLQKIIKKCL